MNTLAKIVKIGLYTIIGIWGFGSLAILASEENADAPLDLSDFIMLKLGAAISLALCVFCGYVLREIGLLPFKSNER